MILHDYACNSCSAQFEAVVAVEQKKIPCQSCGGVAERVYRRMSGMPGKNKGVYPYFDVQLGVTLESSSHRDRVAKERGLLVMGNDEFKRSRNAPRTPNPMDSDEVDPVLIETAKRAWDDVKFGRVPNEEQRVLDIASTVEADVLDVKDAPSVDS